LGYGSGSDNVKGKTDEGGHGGSTKATKGHYKGSTNWTFVQGGEQVVNLTREDIHTIELKGHVGRGQVLGGHVAFPKGRQSLFFQNGLEGLSYALVFGILCGLHLKLVSDLEDIQRLD